MQSADVIIIGSGQGGTALAKELGRQGKQVLLFERDRLGGSCVNYGCTPSKTMLAASVAIGRARRAESLGLRVKVEPDFPRIMARVRRVREEWRAGVAQTRELAGVSVVDAEARFVAPHEVVAGGERYRAETIVINTGSRPVIPPIDGLTGTPYLTNRNIFDLERLPESLAVLGGGFIGVELGQAMARFGCQVTLLEANAGILSREDPWVGDALSGFLREDGLDLRLGHEVEQVRHGADGFRVIGGGETIAAEALLVTAGRRPATDALAADAIGLELTDDGAVRIDGTFATSLDGVWAIGDCAGQPPFTHISYEDHLRLLAIWRGEPRRRDDRTLAYAVFSDPQLGRVGMDRAAAEAAGREVIVLARAWDELPRAVEWGHRGGRLEVLIDAADGRLLGATLLGYEAAELVQVFLPLIDQRQSWRAMRDSVFVHPTYTEALRSLVRQAAEKVGSRGD